MEHSRFIIQTKGLIIQTKMSTNRTFVLLAKSVPEKPACLYTSTKDTTHLWHCRYGHLSYKGLRTLQYKKMVHGLPQFNPPATVCENCMIGKQHRDPIPKISNWRATEKLQLVHADLCGPISPRSNSKKRYLICFNDDFTRKTWVYFLVEKSEALSMFIKFKSCVEKEVGDISDVYEQIEEGNSHHLSLTSFVHNMVLKGN